MYKFLAIILLSLVSTITYAADEQQPRNNVVTQDSTVVTKETIDQDRQHSQKIIEQFESYLRTIPEKTVEEISQFRKDIANLNKQKKKLYRTLSKQAQLYLAQEQDFKKRLPIKDRKSLNKLRKDYMQKNAPKAPQAPGAPKAPNASSAPSAPNTNNVTNLQKSD